MMYRPKSVRNFKKFIGELTATEAAIYIAMCELENTEKDYTSIDGKSYWENVTEKHGVILDGVKTEIVQESQVRLSIVSLYSAFDRFYREIKKENLDFGKGWEEYKYIKNGDKAKSKKLSPLDAIKKSINKKKISEVISNDQYQCFEYYRFLRNSIVHPIENNGEVPKKHFNSYEKNMNKIKNKYSMQSAPNKPEDLSFHDIKLLCKLLLDMTENIATAFYPGDTMLADSFPVDILEKFKKRLNNKKKPNRLNNAVVGYLKSTYGLSSNRSLNIMKSILAH